MENYIGDVINWRELAESLLDYMYDCHDARWTAQWLWDENWSIDAINYLLGTDYIEEEMEDPERYGE